MCSALHKKNRHGNRNRNKKSVAPGYNKVPFCWPWCLEDLHFLIHHHQPGATFNLCSGLHWMFPLSCHPHIYILISLHIPWASTHWASQQFGPWKHPAVAGQPYGNWDTHESYWTWWLYSCSVLNVVHEPFPHVSKKGNWIGLNIPHDCSISRAWVPRYLSRRPTSLSWEVSLYIQYYSLTPTRTL